MNYIEFLNRPIMLKNRIEHQIEDVNYRWEVCQNITQSLHERVQTSPTNHTERSYISYIEAKRKLDSLYSEYDEARTALQDFLYKNLAPDYADILEWRYIDGKTLHEIAEIRGLTYESAKNKMAKANRESEKRYNCY